MSRSVDEGSRRDRAGINHRIERPVATLVEDNRIERFAGRFDADFAEHVVEPAVFQRYAIDEWFRDRLNREQIFRVAGFVNLAVSGHERDAEQARIGLGQLGDIGRHLAAEVLLVFGMDLLQRCEDR